MHTVYFIWQVVYGGLLAIFDFMLSKFLLPKKLKHKLLTPHIIETRVFEMSKWNKLLAHICSLSKDVRFDELRKILENYGYEVNLPRSGSSHYTFRKSGYMLITIPKHEQIKKVYVEMIRLIVESEGKNDENAG